jgi:tetratricopeptide (TPR) repeat protein
LLLKNTYKNILNEFGVNNRTIDIQRGLAHLYAFYLNEPDTAMEILNQSILLGGLEAKTIAECKLELADIILFTGEMWEPSLLYSQVEKSFKQEPIGQEAKFRNARLSYYQGDFDWAQGQLTVLKAATSKLISNDALDLSLLIMENLDDSVAIPLHIFSRADLLMFQNADSIAYLVLDSISNMFPLSTLNDDVLLKKYKIKLKQGNYNDCKVLLEQLLSKYGSDVLADDATYYLAELYQYKFKNTEEAKKNYEKVLIDYPGSLFSVEARKRFRKLRGDTVN